MPHSFIETPLGIMLAVAEYTEKKENSGENSFALTRLDFIKEAGKNNAPPNSFDENTPLFDGLRLWLADYFSKKKPELSLPLKMRGTAFQSAVWDLLLKIPYGKTATYGMLAKQIAEMRGIAVMSAQAVGGAVGSNPISILVPCHRVIGSDGGLTGYAGGLSRKRALLELEGFFL